MRPRISIWGSGRPAGRRPYVRPSVRPLPFKQNRRERRFQPARRILLPARACFLNNLSSDPLSYHLTIHLLFQLPKYQSNRSSISLPIQPSIYPTFHLLVHPSACTVDFPSIHLSNVHPFSHSFCLYISPSIRVSTHQPIYLVYFLSICFSIYLLSVHRSIHLILCLSSFIYPRKSIHLSIYLVPFPVHLLFHLSPDPWRFRQSKKDDSPSVKTSLLKTLDKK